MFTFRVSVTSLITGATVFGAFRMLNAAVGVSLIAAAGTSLFSAMIEGGGAVGPRRSFSGVAPSG
jgi:hypothetical protein